MCRCKDETSKSIIHIEQTHNQAIVFLKSTTLRKTDPDRFFEDVKVWTEEALPEKL